MTLVARLPFVGGLLPDDPAARGIKRIQHPLVRGGVIRRIGAVVRAGLEGCASAAADRARHEQPIAPDDRTRVSEPRNARAPQDVLALLDVPAVGQLLPVCNAGRLRTAERRPAPGAITGPRQPHRRVEHRSRHGSRRREIRLSGRRPARLVEEHQAWCAGVADHREAELFAVHLESILSCGPTTVERNRHGLQ